jgi:hypothetical protein
MHIFSNYKFNKNEILNNIFYFIKNAFIKKTNIPIISILLFIFVITLNSIQYSNNKNYLQNNIIISNTAPNINNFMLFIYDLIGINAFINDTPAIVFYFILTYGMLSLIEMNIGYIPLLSLLFVDLMFQYFWSAVQDAICTNNLLSTGIINSPYCCGSFIFFMTFGFVLFIIQKNMNNIYLRLLVILIIIAVFFICSLYEKYNTYSHMNESPQKTCKEYTWHAANFMFGVLCASIISN